MLDFCKAMELSCCGTAFSEAAVQTSCGAACRLRAAWMPTVPGTPQCAAHCSVCPSCMAAWAQRFSVGWPRMLLQPAQPLFRWAGPCLQSPSWFLRVGFGSCIHSCALPALFGAPACFASPCCSGCMPLPSAAAHGSAFILNCTWITMHSTPAHPLAGACRSAVAKWSGAMVCLTGSSS